MNFGFAKEVGIFRYLLRRILWKINPPDAITLLTGPRFPLPKEKFFASDVFVTEANVDWNAEYILAAYLKSKRTSGDFLDIGAHIGYYTCLLSPFCSSAWAFEPDSRNFPFLEKTLANLDNAQHVKAAVADQEGEVVFSDSDESSISHIDPDAPIDRAGKSTVSVVTVDSFVKSNALQPSAIKLILRATTFLLSKARLKPQKLTIPFFW